MKKKKLIRTIAIIGVAGLIIGGGIGLYMFNKPHRDVQSAQADYMLTSSQIVTEYLTDNEAANQKYLAADGDSKILEISGEVNKISENFNGQKVVLLKGGQDRAGVSAIFTAETNDNLNEISLGQTITVKGVIRSGASYDEDLEMYEHVILEKSDIVIE
ncbi:MAG: hypothetical protein KAS29_07585 [Bacteroidales bacterium]|nr:hypothetical protein [Bacteroidales bacterium]